MRDNLICRAFGLTLMKGRAGRTLSKKKPFCKMWFTRQTLAGNHFSFLSLTETNKCLFGKHWDISHFYLVTDGRNSIKGIFDFRLKAIYDWCSHFSVRAFCQLQGGVSAVYPAPSHHFASGILMYLGGLMSLFPF